MSNQITANYNKTKGIWDQKEEILQKITQKTGFQDPKLIYNGKILSDMSQVITLIYEGKYHNKECVLKIVGINHTNPEPEIIAKFESQNTSQVIRHPKIYFYEPFNKDRGYYFYIMEKVQGTKLYDLPIIKDPNNPEFVTFITEYYTKARTQPFFPASPLETNSQIFIRHRIYKWIQIANEISPITLEELAYLNQFEEIINKVLVKLPMEFQHRHFRLQDITKVKVNKNNKLQGVLFSSAFWSYVPKYYSLTFHLWAAIEDTYKMEQFPDIDYDDLIKYIEGWKQIYLNSFFITDPNFEQFFDALILERAIGSIIIDLRVRHKRLGQDRFGDAYNYMFEAWRYIFKYYYQKLSPNFLSTEFK